MEGFNIGSQNADMIINIGSEDRIKELEQQVKDLETALAITNNSRKYYIEEYNKLVIMVRELQGEDETPTTKTKEADSRND